MKYYHAFNLGVRRLSLPPKLLLIMKLTTFILMIALAQVSAKGFGQKINLDVKNMPVEKVLESIKLQSGYVFFYTPKDVMDAKITVHLQDADIATALKECFKSLPLTYNINTESKDVLVVEKERSLLDKVKAVTLNLFQSIDVQGKIVDEKGVPIPGATVRVKGSAKAAVTDKQGMFLLSKVSQEAVLLVSYIGYETREVKADDLGDGVITLKMTSNDLNEVMINRGYYTEKQRFSVGNVTKVSGEDIAKQPVSDPLLALQGRVPGLYISQTSGVPGSYSTIMLRGQNSIPNGKPVTVNDPLFIVDGIPYSSESLTNTRIGGGAAGTPSDGRGHGLSPFNNLNPADIESIEVLKDADATAIYGSRGSNGVILITTKKGKAGETKVDVDVSTGVGKVAHKIDLMNTQQYLQMRHEAFKNDGATPQSYDFDVNGTWDTTRYTDWQKVLIGNNAVFTNVQASVSGGNANTQFLVGAGYNKQGTVFPGDYGDQKGSVHFSLNNTSNNHKFKIQLTGSYLQDNSNLPQADFTGNITLPPDAPAIYDKAGNINWELQGGSPTWQNPLAATNQQAKAITDNLIGNMVLSYQILEGLQIKSSFGYSHSQMNQSLLTFSNVAPPPDNTNPYVRANFSAVTDRKSWIIEPGLDYHKQTGSWVIDALLGTTIQQNSGKSSAIQAQGFSSDALITDPIAASSVSLLGYNASQYKYNAVFGRFSAKLKERYLLNITARRDGSSRFGQDRQFGNFGAVGAGWIFTEEPFLKNALPWLSFGKVRASYGVTGNDAIGDYQFLSTYSVYNPSYQGYTGLFPTSLTNPYFSWERDKKLEAGIELGFLKDRIFLTTSYYRNRTDNQLVNYVLPQSTGFGGVQANFPAIIQNSGLELTLNTKNIVNQDFSWTSSINMSIPRNKLVAFPGIENSSYRFNYEVGQSMFVQYLYHYLGVNSQTGIYTFASKDGSGVPIYGVDQNFSKPLTQSFFGGFQNTFHYKQWELDVFLQFVKQTGHSYLSVFQYPGMASNIPVVYFNRWQKPGDHSDIQKFTQTYSNASQSFDSFPNSDGIITDASFIRLKSVALSYQFPAVWIKKMKTKNASVFVHCENLFTITRYQLLDPETQGLGLPPLRMLTAGIHLSL